MNLMYIIKYFYCILYWSYFVGFLGFVYGSINGYNEAKDKITKFENEFETFYDIINEYVERIIKRAIFFGLIVFGISVLFLILFPIFIIYLSILYFYHKIINFLYWLNYKTRCL
jgi:hypothetical protein